MNIKNQLWPLRFFIEQYGKESVSKQCLDFVRAHFHGAIDIHTNTSRYIRQARRLNLKQLKPIPTSSQTRVVHKLLSRTQPRAQ